MNTKVEQTAQEEFSNLPRQESQVKEIWNRFRRNRPAMISLVVLVVIILLAVFANQIADYEGMALYQDMTVALKPPSAEHWFGTDKFGRDIFARVIHGARISLLIGVLVTAIALVIGTLLGASAGYFGGWLDSVIMRGVDIIMCIPPVLFSIAIVTALGTNVRNLVLALVLSYSPIFTRVIRSALLSVVGMEYVEAARASGSGHFHIIFRHVLPNAIGPIIVQGTMSMGSVILNAASMSFLGMGVKAPTPEWGVMISEASELMRAYPHLVIFPGLALVITVLAVNLVGDGLRDALDPRLKD